MIGSVVGSVAGESRGSAGLTRLLVLGVAVVVGLAGCGGGGDSDAGGAAVPAGDGVEAATPLVTALPTVRATPLPTPTLTPSPTPSPTSTAVPVEDLWLEAAGPLAVEWVNEIFRISDDPRSADPVRLDRLAAREGDIAYDGTDFIDDLFEENIYQDISAARAELIDGSARYVINGEGRRVIEVEVCTQEGAIWRSLDDDRVVVETYPGVFITTVEFREEPPLRVLSYGSHHDRPCTFTKPPELPLAEPTPIRAGDSQIAHDQLLADAEAIAHEYYDHVIAVLADPRGFDPTRAWSLEAPHGSRHGRVARLVELGIEDNEYYVTDGLVLTPVEETHPIVWVEGEQVIEFSLCVVTSGIWRDLDTGEVVLESDPDFMVTIGITANRPLLVASVQDRGLEELSRPVCGDGGE